ncbi:hypothetical protein Tco_1369242 [Tanacetum coccineum]
MAALKFASSYNMVAFLDKPTESVEFEQIVDFLNARPIKYALTVNPTIYTSCMLSNSGLLQVVRTRLNYCIDELCTSLSQRVLDLENTKTSQAVEITELKKREEKARKHGKVFNWETAKYGKIWYDEDIHDLRSVKTEFPAIAFNDEVSSEKTLSCEPTVSSLNDEIDFRIFFDDSDDEDYTVIFDKNSFSYKIISTNDLKTDLENDNEKVNLPSLPSPELTVSCFDDLDFFNDFENEFPAIVYNDAQTSKSDLLTEPILNPQDIDEFDLNDETSLSEYDEEEQNILYFNDLFPST